MCTATWLADGEGLHFLFNRDERRTRPRGLPPRAGARDRVRYLAPIDAAAGGTWIAVNELGLLFALLNRTEEGAAPATGTLSRGSIIPALVAASSLERAGAALAALDLGRLAPFRLAVRDPGAGAMTCFGWDGARLDFEALDPSLGLLCSSSLGDARVTRARAPRWARLFENGRRATLDDLRRFQRSHEPERSADSVCMHRDDAQTVSHVEILVDGASAVMRYVDGAPCEGSWTATERLERSR